MSQIFFDTHQFVYLLKDTGNRGAEVAELLERMEERGDALATSMLTLAELLVKPSEKGDMMLAGRYEAVLRGSGIRLISFDYAAAAAYSRIRADRSIKAPDALQLACAASAGCDVFVTNETALTRKKVDGIQFIVTPDRVPI